MLHLMLRLLYCNFIIRFYFSNHKNTNWTEAPPNTLDEYSMELLFVLTINFLSFLVFFVTENAPRPSYSAFTSFNRFTQLAPVASSDVAQA